MKRFNPILSLITVAWLALSLQACQSPIIGGCANPNSDVELFESFTTGYRNDVDSLYIAFLRAKPSEKPEASYWDPDPIFDWSSPWTYPTQVGANTDFAIGVHFYFRPHRQEQYNAGDENSQAQKSKLSTLSKQYGDTNYKRMVSPLTFKQKAAASGRVVLEEKIQSIQVFCNTQFGEYSAFENISSAFILAFTNPLLTATKHQNFEPSQAGTDYLFAPFCGCICDIGGLEKVEPNEQNDLFKTRFPEPFQWYDGEYFPTVQYQTLSDVNFAEIPHLSAMVALIPKVFPSIPGDYSFTIEVQFTNGKILRTTTPLIGFSGQ